MLNDIIETLVKELQNERNQEHVYNMLGPISYRIKMGYYIIIVLLILMIGNLFYTNMMISELVKSSKKSLFTS